jgi:hypothetical protein
MFVNNNENNLNEVLNEYKLQGFSHDASQFILGCFKNPTFISQVKRKGINTYTDDSLFLRAIKKKGLLTYSTKYPYALHESLLRIKETPSNNDTFSIINDLLSLNSEDMDSFVHSDNTYLLSFVSYVCIYFNINVSKDKLLPSNQLLFRMIKAYKNKDTWDLDSVSNFLGLSLFKDEEIGLKLKKEDMYLCAIHSFNTEVIASTSSLAAVSAIISLSLMDDHALLDKLTESDISLRLKRHLISRFITDSSVIFDEGYSDEVKGLILEAISI